LSWLTRGFSERSGIQVDISIDDGAAPLSRPIATALFRVAQEALSNVHRHSGSKRARLALYGMDDVVQLDIIDGGTGLNAPARASGEGARLIGVGISGMRLRLEQLGGQLEIQSSHEGTRVSARVPVKSCNAGGRSPNELSATPSEEP
jgi:signal transduction histidine kinase